MLVFFTLIAIISINVFMIKELIPMTKDIPAVITGKYAVSKFYIADKRSRSRKNLIISEYVTAEDYKTGELIEIGFYYDSNTSKGEIKTIAYLPYSHIGITR